MVELLAPAGNIPMVEAVVSGGANAIYVGPRGWSRRRDQYELSDDEVHAAVEIAHGGGAKLRVAINTNMQSREIAPMLRKMERYVSWGVDGAIMTDIGAIAEVNRRFPELGKYLQPKCGERRWGYCDEDYEAWQQCPIGRKRPHKRDLFQLFDSYRKGELIPLEEADFKIIEREETKVP